MSVLNVYRFVWTVPDAVLTADACTVTDFCFFRGILIGHAWHQFLPFVRDHCDEPFGTCICAVPAPDAFFRIYVCCSVYDADRIIAADCSTASLSAAARLAESKRFCICFCSCLAIGDTKFPELFGGSVSSAAADKSDLVF